MAVGEDGAQERTRTSTPLRAPAPEAGASTNSATWARERRFSGRAARLKGRGAPCQRQDRRAKARFMIDRFEELVTVFGGGGFIGRYVCEFLMKSGVRVRVAQRNPKQAYIIQPLGQVGQFGFVQADITNRDTVQRALEGASVAVNLVGVFGSKMRGVHVDGARNIAEAASDRGLDALVHVSAIGADPNSPSNYGRTKAEGEDEVRTAFPHATIVRPSLVFGSEDELTNRFAAMARLAVLPVIAAARKFQPVFVRDISKAIAMAALDPQQFGGRTYEIGGPR